MGAARGIHYMDYFCLGVTSIRAQRQYRNLT